MANDSVRLSDEMASALEVAAHVEHTRDDLGAAVVRRFGSGADRPVDGIEALPPHVLGELVVLLDAGGCQDLDAAVHTALAAGDGGGSHDAAHSVAHDLCGELAERHFMP